jgi:glycerol-3-phosphate dehydrogenase
MKSIPKGVSMLYDVIIMGAGVVGGAIARELSRYDVNVLALEKETDVCCGTSKANTGIIHTPCLVKKGTKKAEYNIRGNLLFTKLAKELGVPLQWPGALILAYSEGDRKVLEEYKAQGEETRNTYSAGDCLYRFIERDELIKIEPSLNKDVICALFAPDAGRIIPYEFGIALWENAINNGIELKLDTRVELVSPTHGDFLFWKVKTEKEEFSCKYLINAAGHGSNSLGVQAGFEDISINKVKGQYLIYDRNRDFDINHILFQVPSPGKGKAGKGILVTKTVYGNLMIGPDASGVESDHDTGTDLETLKQVMEGARKSIPQLDIRNIIKTFAGVRPRPESGDFIIESRDHFYHLCGIESPGLTSSPAIAEDILKMLKSDGLELKLKVFDPFRKPIVDTILDLESGELKRRVDLPDSDPRQIVCRCEQVPRSRIMDALNRGIPVTTMDGVKRRTRAGQGSCQNAFCGKRVRKLLSEELGISVDSVRQRGNEAFIKRITGRDLKEME